jgi:hypothetical protein
MLVQHLDIAEADPPHQVNLVAERARAILLFDILKHPPPVVGTADFVQIRGEIGRAHV